MSQLFDHIKNAFSPSPKNPAAPNDGMPNPSNAPVETAPPKPATPAPQVDLKAPIYNSTPEEIQAAVSKFDFTNQPQFAELATQAFGQGADLNAVKQLLNTVAQAAFAQSAQVSSNLSEQAAFNIADRLNAQIPGQITSMQSSQILSKQLDSLYNNPVYAPTVKAIQQSILQSDPTATADQVATRTIEHFSKLADTFKGATTPAANQRNAPIQSMPTSLTYADIFKLNTPQRQM